MNGIDFNYSSLAKRIKLAKKILLYKEGFILHENSPSSDIMRWDLAVLFAKCMFALPSDNLKRGNKYAWGKCLWTEKPPIGYKKKHTSKTVRKPLLSYIEHWLLICVIT